MVLSATWRLAGAKSDIVDENNADAACMDDMERTKIKSSIQTTSHQLRKLIFVNG